MPETAETVTLLDQLRGHRRTKIEERAAALTKREKERSTFESRKDATEEEREAFANAETAFDAAFDQMSAEIDTLDRRIKEQKAQEVARRAAAKASRPEGVAHVQDPLTYREDNAGAVSYFHDLAYTNPTVAGAIGGNASEALDRLMRHAKETEDWLPKRQAERERRAEKRIEAAERAFRDSFVTGVRRGSFDASPFERRVNPNRTDGQGGYFVPPLWLIDEYLPGLRAGRVAAGLCRQMDLPEGTDSINIPKLSTLTQVAPQNADNAGVASQDYTDTSVQANVKTLAGQEDVAIQLIEQSPGQIVDRVIMEDLIADYNRLVDRMVLFGSGVNTSSLNAGQVAGIYPSTNWTTNTVTWTSGSPLGTGFNMVAGAMASKIAYNRYDLSNVHYLLHPRRWFWFATALDGASGTAGRPLVVNPAFGPFNASALEQSSVPFEGLAGRMPFGPNVYIDANVPTTDNGSGALTGTNDLAIAAKWDDLWLFEGNLRTRVLPEILSGTLEIRYQVYNYVAFLVRYGQSITLAQGTGFGAPTSALDSSVTF